jgi:NADPH2:quinone reductase
MKAIRTAAFGGPEVLTFEDIADPTPGAGEVVVDIKAAGLNPSDVYMLTGVYLVVPDLPFTPGYDAAGVVSAPGDGVGGLNVGDRVIVGAPLSLDGSRKDLGITGCFAEKVVRRAADLSKLPDNTSFAQGAAIGVPYATAHYGLFGRGGGKAGETVFIHGASGAVGTAAIQLAKRAGMQVIGSAGTAQGLDLVRELGADLAVNHREDGYIDEVRKASNGGPQLILEMLANENLATDLDLIPKFGRIVIIGARAETTINPRAIMMKDADVRGLVLFNASREDREAIMDDLVAGLADGSLSPIIGTEMPLADTAAAYTKVMEPGAHGKIALIP